MRLAAKAAGEARWYHGVIRPYRLIRAFFYSMEEGQRVHKPQSLGGEEGEVGEGKEDQPGKTEDPG